jgi:hypothetical protein
MENGVMSNEQEQRSLSEETPKVQIEVSNIVDQLRGPQSSNEEEKTVTGSSGILLQVPATVSRSRLSIASKLSGEGSDSGRSHSISIASDATAKSYERWKQQFKEDRAYAKKEMNNAVTKIRDQLTKIKAAIDKQKNVSRDIKNSVPIIEKQLKTLDWHHKDLDRGFEESGELWLEEIHERKKKRADKRHMLNEKRENERAKLLEEVRRKRGRSPTASPEKRENEKRTKKSRRSGVTVEENTLRGDKPAKATKKRTAAVFLKPEDGKSFSDVLKKMKDSMNPKTQPVDIRAIRRTREGNVLIELDPDSADKEAFGQALRTALQDVAKVRTSTERKIEIEIRDLEATTDVSDIQEAFDSLFKSNKVRKIFLTKPNSREVRLAVATLDEEEAEKLLLVSRLRVGFVNCRVRKRVTVSQCYKCLGYGHVKKECQGPDRSDLCYRCGVSGHKTKDCQNEPRCFLCSAEQTVPIPVNHRAGSGACLVFRRALETAKKDVRIRT